MAIKPKQWLYDNGHTTTVGGRGRMSKEHKALILAAVESGVDIEGYAVVERATAATNKPAKAERVKVDPNRVVDVPDETRNEREVMAYYMEGPKRVEVGMRTVDNNCGSSLTYCPCESPRVWVDHDRQVVVNFRSRN